MIGHPPSSSFDLLRYLCPCKASSFAPPTQLAKRRRRRRRRRNWFSLMDRDHSPSPRFGLWVCSVSGQDVKGRIFNGNSTRRLTKDLVLRRLENEVKEEESEKYSQLGSNFANFKDDPMVGKLRTELGVIHPIPSPRIGGNVMGLFVLFFFVGVVFDKIWTKTRRKLRGEDGGGQWPQVPMSLSLFLENDLQRKESVEWVNMVLGKLWNVYRSTIENWIVGLLQPVIDDLEKPGYVERVEIKQFSLGDEPLSLRSIERKTSRQDNDLQYQVGLRYTGSACMLLLLSLKFGIIPIALPVGVRDFDIDGEIWVKLRLMPTEPWVGVAQWAFVSLPKIKFELSPFRLFNLMAIPVLSMILKKLLTEDLPQLFVRPNKIVLDFENGKAVGPVAIDIKSREMQEGNKDFLGELSVTLVDARSLSYVFFGKTDPYVVLSLGDQVIQSKKNSQTTVIGPPGKPIWNQDFHMLVASPRKQKLLVQVKDSLGFTDFTVGIAEVDLGSLRDTVPTDRIVALRGGWGVFRKGFSGEILLRLTYKAYVKEEGDDKTEVAAIDADAPDDEISESYDPSGSKSFMDLLAALMGSDEFQAIVASETRSSKTFNGISSSMPRDSRSLNNTRLVPSDSSNPSEGLTRSTLVWFAIVTSILVVIALTLDGSSYFNP